MNTATTPALLARDIHRHFGAVRAVDGVDLGIERGEIVALLGPNGAGKTTFLDMVLGFTAPTSGTLEVLGTRPEPAVRAGRVAAVLQTGGLLDDLTVRETVTMVAGCHHRALRPDEAISRAGATGIAGRKVSRCSGGERQRLRFALALLTEPDLLVLDEPTAGMDVGARAEFWDTMHDEAERGRTVVFATHYLQEAADFADRVVLLSRGRVVGDGDARQIVASRGRTVSFRWTGEGDPAETLAGLGLDLGRDLGLGPLTEREGRLHVRAQDSDALARHLLTHGLASDLEIVSASLDEVFLELTEGNER